MPYKFACKRQAVWEKLIEKKRSGFLPEAREIMKGKVLATREKSFACQLKLWPEVHITKNCASCKIIVTKIALFEEKFVFQFSTFLLQTKSF